MFLKPTVLPVLLPRGSRSQPILLNSACSNPDPLLLRTTLSPSANTDTRALPALWEAYYPGFPRALIPLLSTRHGGAAMCCLSLGFHNPYHWHTNPRGTTDPILHVDMPEFPSLNLLRCREKEAFQCFNLSSAVFSQSWF